MKTIFRTICTISFVALLSFQAEGQISVKKPTIKKPKVNVGGKTVEAPTKDPSGLFKNCTSDPSAASHRKNAVSNLEALEAEYKKESADYELVKKLIFNNERTLGQILKLEPKVKADAYYARYTPLKERTDSELAIYDQIKGLEKVFNEEFISPYKYENYNPMTFRTDSYGSKDECFCRVYDHEKSLDEYNSTKKQYDDLASKLVGYSHEGTQKLFKNMATCLENGNAYAIWASKDNVQTAVVDFSAKEKALNPEKVIKRCDDYLAGLERIESDNSLNLSTEAKAAMTDGKSTTNATKKEAERYISSGDFEAHKAKLHAEKIAKEFLPKAVSSNSSLQEGAKKYVKGAEMNTYITERLDRKPVTSTLKAHVVTTKPYIKKNEYDLPKYKYHEIWVAFKDADGKCYKTLVYATYQYMGGGTYEKVPTYSADRPIEMACANL